MNAYSMEPVTYQKVYVLYYDESVDYDILYDDAIAILKSLPKGSVLIPLPKYYKFEEFSIEELKHLRSRIDQILDSRNA